MVVVRQGGGGGGIRLRFKEIQRKREFSMVASIHRQRRWSFCQPIENHPRSGEKVARCEGWERAQRGSLSGDLTFPV